MPLARKNVHFAEILEEYSLSTTDDEAVSGGSDIFFEEGSIVDVDVSNEDGELINRYLPDAAFLDPLLSSPSQNHTLEACQPDELLLFTSSSSASSSVSSSAASSSAASSSASSMTLLADAKSLSTNARRGPLGPSKGLLMEVDE
jgi:hypothetical protein